jgi:thioesterase domain-containing protein/acyl carrier protein
VFVRLEALPLTFDGKIDAGALPPPGGVNAPQGQDEYVAPRDALELQLAQIWEEVLDTRPVGGKSNFFALGGHSLSAMTLLIRIQEEFGRELPLPLLIHGASIESVANMLRGPHAPSRPSSLVPLKPEGTRRPFFCVHPIAGNLIAYTEIAQRLAVEQPFYGLQSRGVSGEQPPLTRIEEMAATYLEEVKALQPEGPYLLGGWSFGGVVAFEMASRLRTQGQQVSLLVLIDSFVPNAEASPPSAAGAEDEMTGLLTSFLSDLSSLYGQDAFDAFDKLKTLDADAQLHYGLEMVKRYNILPPGIGLSQIEHLLQVFKTNLRALRDYQPQTFDGKVVLLRASETHDEAAADATPGWSRFVTQPIEIHSVRGNHYTMLTKPLVQDLAEHLNNCLAQAQP